MNVHAIVSCFDTMDLRRMMMMAATTSGATSRVEATGRVVRILGVIKIIETRQRSDSESSMQGV